jgi:3-hydroxyisobutyrate dehydrogenase-like beta-hydroxyacid dehydrogenase
VKQEQAMAQETIGFIGVGFMGHGMAKNIVEKGYPLTVMGHRNRAPVEDLVARGANEAQSVKELAKASTIVFLCVTGSKEVEALLRGSEGLVANLAKGSIIVDCSTSDPTSTMALFKECEARGVTLVDAPLGRTPKEAWEGTLDTMVGATDAVFERLKPVLATWSGRAVHIGGPGDGHKMKLINNFLSLGYAALYSEALSLANKVGITPDRFDSVIRGGRMDCGFYQTFMKYTLERDRDAHKFSLANAFKDMRYLESMADDAGIANPLGNAVKNSYALAINAGRENDFVPMLADIIAHANGTSLEKK